MCPWGRMQMRHTKLEPYPGKLTKLVARALCNSGLALIASKFGRHTQWRSTGRLREPNPAPRDLSTFTSGMKAHRGVIDVSFCRRTATGSYHSADAIMHFSADASRALLFLEFVPLERIYRT